MDALYLFLIVVFFAATGALARAFARLGARS